MNWNTSSSRIWRSSATPSPGSVRRFPSAAPLITIGSTAPHPPASAKTDTSSTKCAISTRPIAASTAIADSPTNTTPSTTPTTTKNASTDSPRSAIFAPSSAQNNPPLTPPRSCSCQRTSSPAILSPRLQTKNGSPMSPSLNTLPVRNFIFQPSSISKPTTSSPSTSAPPTTTTSSSPPLTVPSKISRRPSPRAQRPRFSVHKPQI